MMKGLPGSGKTTLARILENQPGYVRVSRDDLRLQNSSEKAVLQAQEQEVRGSLEAGQRIIVDDTNLAPAREEHLRNIAREYDAGFSIIDLTDVPVTKAIQQDAARDKPIGAHVIRGMANRYGLSDAHS